MDAQTLRVATRMVAALTHTDDPKAADLRAAIESDPTRVDLRAVQEVSGLLCVPEWTFFDEEAA